MGLRSTPRFANIELGRFVVRELILAKLTAYLLAGQLFREELTARSLRASALQLPKRPLISRRHYT